MFDVTCDVDTSTSERLNCYVVANNIPDAAKVSTFNNLAGPKTYTETFAEILSITRQDLRQKVDELKLILKTHVQPSNGILRKQRTSESIMHYVAALKLQAAEGELGNFLRDIFCIRIADVETQKKLRADKTPSFAEARETLSRAT